MAKLKLPTCVVQCIYGSAANKIAATVKTRKLILFITRNYPTMNVFTGLKLLHHPKAVRVLLVRHRVILGSE